MNATVADCPNCDLDELCKQLRDEIMKRVFQTKAQTGTRGLVERIRDQVYGANGPGTDGWTGHDEQITALKNGIKRLLKQHRDNGCPPRLPVPRNIYDLVNAPNPAPRDWKGGAKPADSTLKSVWEWEYWEEATGLTGAALVLYLIVSEGSRLYPPRNLVPVP